MGIVLVSIRFRPNHCRDGAGNHEIHSGFIGMHDRQLQT